MVPLLHPAIKRGVLKAHYKECIYPFKLVAHATFLPISQNNA